MFDKKFCIIVIVNHFHISFEKLKKGFISPDAVLLFTNKSFNFKLALKQKVGPR